MGNNTWTCPECGSVHSLDALFCTNCGARRPEDIQEEEEPQTISFCPACGAKITPDAVFCTSCGARIADFFDEPEDEPADELQNEPENENELADLSSEALVMYLTNDEADNGCRKELILPDGKKAVIDLPGGIKKNSKLRLNNIKDQEGKSRTFILDIVIK